MEGFFKELKEWVTVIGVIVAAVLSYLAQRKAQEVKTEVTGVKTELAVTKTHIDGMQDKLIEAVKGRAEAEGREAGAAQEQTRVQSQPVPEPAHPTLADKSGVGLLAAQVVKVASDAGAGVAKAVLEAADKVAESKKVQPGAEPPL